MNVLTWFTRQRRLYRTSGSNLLLNSVNLQHLEHSFHSWRAQLCLLGTTSMTNHLYLSKTQRDSFRPVLTFSVQRNSSSKPREFRCSAGRTRFNAGFSPPPPPLSTLVVLIWARRHFWSSCTMCWPASPRPALNRRWTVADTWVWPAFWEPGRWTPGRCRGSRSCSDWPATSGWWKSQLEEEENRKVSQRCKEEQFDTY